MLFNRERDLSVIDRVFSRQDRAFNIQVEAPKELELDAHHAKGAGLVDKEAVRHNIVVVCAEGYADDIGQLGFQQELDVGVKPDVSHRCPQGKPLQELVRENCPAIVTLKSVSDIHEFLDFFKQIVLRAVDGQYGAFKRGGGDGCGLRLGVAKHVEFLIAEDQKLDAAAESMLAAGFHVGGK